MRKPKQLPLQIDLTVELDEIRAIQKEKEAIPSDSNIKDVATRVMRKIDSAPYQLLMDKCSGIEARIDAKLKPVMRKYMKRGDYEGAKCFIGRSYMEVQAASKTLLFREIIMDESQKKSQE